MAQINFHYSENWSINEIIFRMHDEARIFSRISTKKYNTMNLQKYNCKIVNLNNLIVQINDISQLNSSISLLKTFKHWFNPTTKLILNNKMTLQFINNLENLYNSNNSIRTIGLISAGISDMPYILEAFIILTCMNYKVNIKMDYGINKPDLLNSAIIEELNTNIINIVIAGMENALTDVIAHKTKRPILAVPSDISYGFGKNGESSLMSLLNSPTLGIGIFNITNVYGACCAINRIYNCNRNQTVLHFDSIDPNALTLLNKESNAIIFLEEKYNGTMAAIIAAKYPHNLIFVTNIYGNNNLSVTMSLLNVCVGGIIYVNNFASCEKFLQMLKDD